MKVYNPLKWNRILAGGAIIFLIFAVTAPVGPVYGMSQIKSLANRIRPGTFPELESEKKTSAEAADAAAAESPALTDTEKQILLSLKERKRFLDQRDLLLNQREEQPAWKRRKRRMRKT